MLGDFEGFNYLENLSQFERLKALEHASTIPNEVREILHKLRKSGNKGSHTGEASVAEARFMLSQAFHLCVWFYELYEEENLFAEFVMPSKVNTSSDLLEKVKEELETTKEELIALKAKALIFKEASEAQKEDRKIRAKKLIRKVDESEAETRDRIDKQLRDAGWQCDTQTLNYKKNKTMPQKARQMAIAEWKCGSKWADYALFNGLELIGIVEAKKHNKNVMSDLGQAQKYSQLVTQEHNKRKLNRKKLSVRVAQRIENTSQVQK